MFCPGLTTLSVPQPTRGRSHPHRFVAMISTDAAANADENIVMRTKIFGFRMVRVSARGLRRWRREKTVDFEIIVHHLSLWLNFLKEMEGGFCGTFSWNFYRGAGNGSQFQISQKCVQFNFPDRWKCLQICYPNLKLFVIRDLLVAKNSFGIFQKIFDKFSENLTLCWTSSLCFFFANVVVTKLEPLVPWLVQWRVRNEISCPKIRTKKMFGWIHNTNKLSFDLLDHFVSFNSYSVTSNVAVNTSIINNFSVEFPFCQNVSSFCFFCGSAAKT